MNNIQIDIANQITSGFVSIDSVKDFERLLRRFPEDPALHRMFSDLLIKNKLPNAAATSYGKAAELYLKSGQLLQAMVSRILQWEIYAPSYRSAQLFFSALREGSYPDSPSKVFFNKLSNPEILTVMKNAVIIERPPDHIVKNLRDAENDLYFVVSGSLKQTIYKPLKRKGTTVYHKSQFHLSENEVFGDIYPFDNQKVSQSSVLTITQVELAKISKDVLSKICRKYPNIENGLAALYDFQSEYHRKEPYQKKRHGIRHQILRKMTLEIYPESSVSVPLILDGYSRNISIGGACVVLDTKDIHVTKSIASFHKTVKRARVKMSFPSEGLELKVSGKIVWTQPVSFKGEETLALGIQFQDLSPKLCGMLFVFAESSRN
jgi:CRP-like cAMP-binding protein